MSKRIATSPLTAQLVDDAAVFPPGLATPERAWRDYLARRESRYAESVGPLLIGTSGVDELITVAGSHPASAPVPVAVIGRPGTPLDAVGDRVHQLHRAGSIQLCGVEIAHQPGWQRSGQWGLPRALEAPPHADALPRVLDEIADAMDAIPRRVAGEGLLRAKLRTQSTPEHGVPSARLLATFILGCVHRGVAFKLTGGLHHAIAHTARRDVSGPGDHDHPQTEDQHGVLNVMLATSLALRGEAHATVTEALELRDPQSVVGGIAALTPVEVTAMRSTFTSLGCCGVSDPLNELEQLHVVSYPEKEPA